MSIYFHFHIVGLGYYNEAMQETEKILWRKVEKYISFLRFVPFLRLVAVCNNLSFGRVSEKSDIDLFIVARAGRLFFVRFLVTFLLHALGVRRHGDKIEKRFCLSFFVDDSYLDLSKIAIYKDIYLAFWVKSLVPILDDGVGELILTKNYWAKEYFESGADFCLDASRRITNKSFLKNLFSKMLDGRLGDVIEGRLKKWQLSRAKLKMKTAGDAACLIVDEHILKFHNNDRRAAYRDLWVSRYGEDAKLNRDAFIAL